MREKEGQDTTGIVRRPKQSKQDRVLRAANTWQEGSIQNHKNSSLPDVGREEQSMARTLVPLNSAGSVAVFLFLLIAGRGSWSCAITEWGKQPILTLAWETLWPRGKRGSSDFIPALLFSIPLK